MKIKESKGPSKIRRKGSAQAARPHVPTVLTATDFSDNSRAGLRYAAALASKLKADVALLHVVETPSWMDPFEALKPSETVALAQAQLAQLAHREVGRDVTVTFSVRTGKPFHEITTAACEGAADLIVIATHGHTGLESALLGSTAERVVRHAPCPVLTVPARTPCGRASKTPPFKLKNILVPIDFSDLSKDALPYASLLARQFDAELVLLHIVEIFPIDSLLGRELTHQTTVPLMRQAEAGLERMAEKLYKASGVKATVAVRAGSPFAEISDAAKTGSADLIVLTTHGHTGLKHVWLGSTAERVVRHASCPVLVVGEGRHESAFLSCAKATSNIVAKRPKKEATNES